MALIALLIIVLFKDRLEHTARIKQTTTFLNDRKKNINL